MKLLYLFICIISLISCNSRTSSSEKLPENQNLTNSEQANTNIEQSYYVRQGLRFYNNGDFVSAMSCYTSAINENVNDVDAFYERGMLHLELNNFNEAIDDFNVLLRMQNIQQYQIENAWMNRAIAYKQLENFSRAVEDFTTLITFTMDNLNRVRIMGYDELVESYRIMLGFAYFQRGICHIELREYNYSIIDFTNAISFDDRNAEYYLKRGLVNMELENYDIALHDLLDSIIIDPNQYETLNNIGIIYMELMQNTNAIYFFTEAIKLNNSIARIYYNRGLAYARIGNLSSAIQDIELASRLAPNNLNYKELLDYLYSL